MEEAINNVVVNDELPNEESIEVEETSETPEVLEGADMEVTEGQLDTSKDDFMPEGKNGNFFTSVCNPFEFWIILIIAFAIGGFLGFLWSKKIKEKSNK